MSTEVEIRKALTHIETNIDRVEVRRFWWEDGREKYEIWIGKSEKRGD